MRFLPVLLIVALPMAAQASPLSKFATKIQPHQAVYDISLISKNAGTQILDITGEMRMSWHHDCDEWITDNETKLTYSYTDGTIVPVTNDYSTVERLDGKSFTFASQRNTPEGIEETKGQALVSEEGVRKAYYTQPMQNTPIELPENTMFPMNHTLEIIRKAVNHDGHFFYAPLFDGNETMDVQYVNTFIGKEHDANDQSIAPMVSDSIDADLLKSRSWDLQLAFFNGAEDAATADYEMSVRAYENGVVSDIVVDYGQFALRQNLIGLKKLEPHRCD